MLNIFTANYCFTLIAESKTTIEVRQNLFIKYIAEIDMHFGKNYYNDDYDQFLDNFGMYSTLNRLDIHVYKKILFYKKFVDTYKERYNSLNLTCINMLIPDKVVNSIWNVFSQYRDNFIKQVIKHNKQYNYIHVFFKGV